jgi:hypothetical protein
MLPEPAAHRGYRPSRKEIEDVVAFEGHEDRAIPEATSPRSGKGNDVAIIPSPKNRTGVFPHIRLKPLCPPR